MNILLYLYYPFFDRHLAGGVQVSMRELVGELARQGLHFRILCSPSSDFPYTSVPDMDVLPILDEAKDDAIEPPHGDQVLCEIESLARDADVIWSIDRRFPIAARQPIVLSLNAICYPREKQALLTQEWDHLIVPSNYALSEVERLLSEHHERAGQRTLSVVPLPVAECFNPCPLGQLLAEKVGYDPQKRYILFPHRPEAQKGHELALEVLRNLLKVDEQYHLLIPTAPRSRYIDIPSEATFINQIQQRINDLNLQSHVTIHEWVEYQYLPEYFSLGECCLFLSTLPETFGLVMVQAIACGTFVVSCGTGALSEIMPPGCGHEVVSIPEPHAIARRVVEGTTAQALEHGIGRIKNLYDIRQATENIYKCLMLSSGRIECRSV